MLIRSTSSRRGASSVFVFSLVALCLVSTLIPGAPPLFVFATEDEAIDTSPEGTKVEADPSNVYVSPQLALGDTCYLAEHFDSGNINVFKSRWVKSEAVKEDVEEEIAKYDGEWNIEAATENALYGDLGLVLKTKAKHHAVSANLDKPFRFTNKAPLVIQYDVRFQEGMECGGAYIKLLSEHDSLSLAQFTDKTPYTIMFGPDKCGNEFKLHFIFRYEHPKTKEFEEKHLTLDGADSFKHIFTDKYSHLLTLTLEPDSKFELALDQTVIKSGSLLTDFKPSVVPPKEIDDPEDKKPEDWDDRAKIPDPEAVKPEDWDETEPEKIPDPEAVKPAEWLDEEPIYIPDPHAEKPEDWDVELDGDWEAPLIENPKCKPGCGDWKAPMVANPKYKGKWRAPQIDNPQYKGVWSPRKIENPQYFEEDNPFLTLAPISAIGLELWSMSNNIIFDNFFITSDSELAVQFASETFLKKKNKERMGYANSDSVIDFLYKSANMNPWLWIVYVLALLLPVICCASYLLSKPSPRKKRTQPKAPANQSNGGSEQQTTSGNRDELEAPEDGAATQGASKGALEQDDEDELDADDEEVEDDEEEAEGDEAMESEDDNDDDDDVDDGPSAPPARDDDEEEEDAQQHEEEETNETEENNDQQNEEAPPQPSQPRKRRSRKD